MKSADGSAGSAGADDYSQTNIQVAGVDEPDFVKNDDKYIYVLSGDELVIIDAYPAERMEKLSTTNIDGTPQELFLSGDDLVVITRLSTERMYFPEYSIWPQPRYAETTGVFIYDVTDREDPELKDEYTVTGSYYEARMVEENIYVVTTEGAYYTDGWIDTPTVKRASETVVRPDIYYFDNPEESYQFATIASFDVNGGKTDAKTFLIGYGTTLYSSTENLYLAYQRQRPYYAWRDQQREQYEQAIIPNLPEPTRSKIESLFAKKNLDSYERWSQISDAMDAMYDELSGNEKETLIEDLQEAIAKYQRAEQEKYQGTVIQKFAIVDGEVDHVAKGEVKGRLLNQFSLDEYGGNLRVATTVEYWTDAGSTMYNNVFVLDEDMDVVGEIEELARDERIYSTRFVGDRLYMVTFKRIDPLFVIDLSDPRNPEVLGKLKIPGFSDYLHPYDKNHIIGIGKETEGNEWGGVSVKGVKIALFDVTDVERPRQVDMIEIGEPGSDSEALHEHKAFLFDREKNLLVLPMREVKASYDYENRLCAIGRCYPYRQRVWQGAYVFKVTADSLSTTGKISHYAGDEQYGWYWGSPNAVKRSLFMDDVLYTISSGKVVASELADPDSVIEEVRLPNPDGSDYFPRPMMGVAVTSPEIAIE